ncbi:sensor histidine kinase [Planctomicrobium piriforme]|uniref:histidine kinase n=1 Tax=Planctomicrobium piriforme TaxID=1576369 RepID=A0A1I3NCA2_9PLAN|nr:HAMP domain-containing sensor histidine kinase [Planctomicrobium piriforme]SFJ06426.1 Signal transduction histidine kinase [Planctomicrobium piriforme]
MLFTRSIRQKLISGLGLVVILVALSTICSFVGVNSFQRTVGDLELSVGKLPRRADLIATLSLLYTPLSNEFPSVQQPLEIQQQAALRQRAHFAEVFKEVRHRVDDFTLSWQQLDEKLRHSPNEQVPYRMLLLTADKGLRTIEESIPGLGELERRDISMRVIMQTAANVIEVSRGLPDPANRLGERLREAKSHYLQQSRLVLGLSAVSVLVLLVLMLWCYRLIFMPIRQLYRGVHRLAAGDYGYRLQIHTQCEIGKLADAFNEMSRRIQEDRQSKEKEIEERSKQLVLSERLAGAGFLASGVAHEINNPLSVIMTAGYGLEMRLSDDVLAGVNEEDRSDIREYLGLIQTEAERCEKITKKLLDFSYGKGDERNRYDITAIVQEVANMVAHLSRYQDRQLSVDRTVPLHAWVNAPEIKQVLLNLVANALDATPPGGYVDVSLREFPDQVEICVEDNGCGMTKEQMTHIFEPFFTTKDVGKGTGLGLAITHRIVSDHGGTLEVHSDGPGQGSRFTLRLPRKAAQVRAA